MEQNNGVVWHLFLRLSLPRPLSHRYENHLVKPAESNKIRQSVSVKLQITDEWHPTPGAHETMPIFGSQESILQNHFRRHVAHTMKDYYAYSMFIWWH